MNRLQLLQHLGTYLSGDELSADSYEATDIFIGVASAATGIPEHDFLRYALRFFGHDRGQGDTGPSEKTVHVPEKKSRMLMTHVGIISECYTPRESRLRETKTMWISESGRRFRKTTGAAVGSGVWSSHRLDLKSIREIQPDE